MLRRSPLFLRFLLSLLVGVMGLAGCHQIHHTSPNPVPLVPYHKATQIRSLPAFTRVVVKGPFNVNLHTGYRRPGVTIYGDAGDLPQVITQVKNNTLIITTGAGYPKRGELTVDIRTRTLNGFTYNGIGTISGMALNTRYLDLAISNPGNTRLGGHIGLHRLVVRGGNVQLSGVYGNNTQVIMFGKPHIQLVGLINFNTLSLRGDGFLSAYWVKNDRLVIKEYGNVHLQLAGIAKVLDVELWDQADFNGRYLRANIAFVKTHGRSVAKISAVNRQHTLASDASDIYFYNLPEMKTDFMAFEGAVLDMRDWNLLCLQEYTVYNK